MRRGGTIGNAQLAPASENRRGRFRSHRVRREREGAAVAARPPVRGARGADRWPDVQVHPTARIEDGVQIGPGSAIWDHVHIRTNASLGEDCIVGEKSYIAYDVEIGSRVKINAFVYIPTGVTLEDDVMVAAGAIFVNDRYPRAFDPRSGERATSAPTEETLRTTVRRGASIGAGATVLGGLVIGRYAMVGAGSVVSRSVPEHALVVGNPARRAGWVCVCGVRLRGDGEPLTCPSCARRFRRTAAGVEDLDE